MLKIYHTTVINDLVKSGQAFALRAYIDQITDSISVSWNIHDIQDYCSDNGIDMSFVKAAEVLARMEDNYDPEVGYNWETVIEAIKEVVDVCE